MVRRAVLSLAALTVTSCASINYIGEPHPPTTQVAVFFSEEDVERPYKVIGQMIATGDQYISSSKLQGKLLAKARAEGADAVIIQRFGRKISPPVTRYTETTTITRDDSTDAEVQRSGTVASATPEVMEIRALFIRYRE